MAGKASSATKQMLHDSMMRRVKREYQAGLTKQQTPGVGALDDGNIRLSAGARRAETTPQEIRVLGRVPRCVKAAQSPRFGNASSRTG